MVELTEPKEEDEEEEEEEREDAEEGLVELEEAVPTEDVMLDCACEDVVIELEVGWLSAKYAAAPATTIMTRATIALIVRDIPRDLQNCISNLNHSSINKLVFYQKICTDTATLSNVAVATRNEARFPLFVEED